MRTLILSPERVRRTLVRLAYEIIERNRGAERLVLVGIRNRGTAVARALADEIGKVESRPMAVNELDVTPFRDDLAAGDAPPDASVMEQDLADRDVVLIDDVLQTGRTVRAALDALVQYGRPRSIQLVVLVDRGHREYPIQPDYVGRVLQTKYTERVGVEVQNGFAVYIEE